MSLIKWRDSYNTGVEQFDEEHHKIVELVEVLFTAVRDGNKGGLEQPVQELIEYTRYHFANEEKAMAEVGYPGLDEHVREHENLTSQAMKFHELGADMSREQVKDFYHFLREWLVDHIVGCDKKYGEYLKNTG